MDIEKLIEGLKTCARLGDSPIMDGFAVIADKRKLDVAATALSTLQAENEKLREEREQVKAERDEAVECINTVYSYILIKSKTDAVRTIEKWPRGQKED